MKEADEKQGSKAGVTSGRDNRVDVCEDSGERVVEVASKQVALNGRKWELVHDVMGAAEGRAGGNVKCLPKAAAGTSGD